MTRRPGETYAELRAAMAARHDADALDRLDAAHALAAHAHQGRVRRSGDPYVTHPVAVALLLVTWDRPTDVVVAGLLHDVLQDGVTTADVRDVAGAWVARLVEGHEHLRAGHRLARSRAVGRLCTRTGRAVGTIKVADRLHNARTWKAVPQELVVLKARQTLDVIAPVAVALGLRDVCGELQTRSTAALAGVVVGSGFPPGPTRSWALVDGRTSRLLDRAVRLLPPGLRDRYRVEWFGDLAALPAGRERTRFAAGLIWSAAAIRADRAGRRRPSRR
ncbi:HD domain-containing protein [Kineosporia sp. A_224]|uniref:HD domain-containing protein n=1 Tax=Kineosporia sp. A_224 TaxID=1962180 RepID=UPI000B4A7F68|nr:HD domain-containing protein [Kineosporia sp. A_224]